MNKKIIIKYIKSFFDKVYEFLKSPITANICTILMVIATFYSANIALKVAFNHNQEYMINNGFYYKYDKETNKNYKYYSISLSNASINKPINLTGGFSLSISTDKDFKSKTSKKNIPKASIDELLNTDKFPINLKYAEEIVFQLNEDFAKYVKNQYPSSRIKVCRKSKNKCYLKPLYIRFCLYDTLDNKYCYVFTEDEINEISKFENGRKY